MTRYMAHGTCARCFDVETDGETVISCRVHGGCPGQGALLSRLATGRRIEDVVPLLAPVVCRNGTSCAAQLAKALGLEMRRKRKT